MKETIHLTTNPGCDVPDGVGCRCQSLCGAVGCIDHSDNPAVVKAGLGADEVICAECVRIARTNRG